MMGLLVESSKPLAEQIATDPYLSSIVLPVVSSFFAAIVFLGFLAWILKPRIKFSDYITKAKFDDTVKHHIKIVNKSRVPLIDVRLSAEIHIDHHENNDTITNIKPVEFKTSRVFTIAKNKFRDEDFDNAIRFSFLGNLEEIWEDPHRSRLVVNVFATHSISNISKVYTKTYKSAECIKVGTFEFGNSCKVNEKTSLPNFQLGLYNK